jgi:hypothetical protein
MLGMKNNNIMLTTYLYSMGLNMIALNVVLFEDGLIDFTPGLYGLFE